MVKHSTILFFLLLLSLQLLAQAPPINDNCSNAVALPETKDYCSSDGQFTTVGATPSFSNSGNDVWFRFTAQAYNLFTTVSGAGIAGTLTAPKIALFSDCNGSGIIGTTASSGNLTTLNSNGLVIGRIYYLQVSGANTGTFKLCFRNENPIPLPGQDCGTASFLCSKNGFVQATLSGPGQFPDEGRGSCMEITSENSERNSAWYKWKAANNGTLVFTLTPTYKTASGDWDDIDWVLFDLGTQDDCSNLPSKVIRCAAGHGVDNTDCPTEPEYYKTGLDFNVSDLNEAGGCGQRQDGKVKFVDMQQGHIYALLVNNFTPGTNGFSLDFKDQNGVTGTGEFVGPKAKIDFVANTPCVAGQSFTFTSSSTDYTGLRWIFGETGDVSIRESTDAGPITVTYNTLGTKTVVLEVTGANGCQTIATHTFSVGIKPLTPTVSENKPQHCIGETLTLTATEVPGATYTWTGPNNFTRIALENTLNIPVASEQVAGTYSVIVTSNGCNSDAGSFTVGNIIRQPQAAFRTDPTLPAKLSYPATIRFINNSTDADAYLWDFGDGNTSTEVNPEHTYTTRGDFTVTLNALNQQVCQNSIQKGQFILREFNSLFIPNTFTPNGDGVNDELVVTMTNMTNYHIRIFNRWGEILFESPDIFNNWKGVFRNGPLPVGTYFYLITATDAERVPVRRSGSVTLIR